MDIIQSLFKAKRRGRGRGEGCNLKGLLARELWEVDPAKGVDTFFEMLMRALGGGIKAT